MNTIQSVGNTKLTIESLSFPKFDAAPRSIFFPRDVFLFVVIFSVFVVCVLSTCVNSSSSSLYSFFFLSRS